MASHYKTHDRPRLEGDELGEQEMEEPANKRVKLEALDEELDPIEQDNDAGCSPQKSRKSGNLVHHSPRAEHIPGPSHAKIAIDLEGNAIRKPSLIQKLVKYTAFYQPAATAQHPEAGAGNGMEVEAKVEAEETLDDEEVQQANDSTPDSQSPGSEKQVESGGADDFAALHNVADAAIALLEGDNEPSDVHNVLESLQSGGHSFEALLAASEGLLSMKAVEPAQTSSEDEEPYAAPPHAFPVATPSRQPCHPWSWSYVEHADFDELLPSWGSRRLRGDTRHDLLKGSSDDYGKDREAKIRKQENMLRDRDRKIAQLASMLKSEKRVKDKRIGELEQELKRQQAIERNQEDELAKMKSELSIRKDEIRHQQTQLRMLKQELTQVHSRRQNDAVAQASDVQEELHKLQNEAVAASSYKAEVMKYQAEAAKHQREADRYAAEAKQLHRSIKQNARERETLLAKLAEMAEQLRAFASLKDRALKMERIVSEIARRCEELRTSGKDCDAEAFLALREIVGESVKLGISAAEAAAATSNGLMDLLAADGEGPGGCSASKEDLAAKEEEIAALKAKCREFGETVRGLEERLEEAAAGGGNSGKAGLWKARVPGGQAGEYHTYRMRSNAQVELPEGTLLSVPCSANMQSSSSSLLTKVHEGDLLNLVDADMTVLTMAELGVAAKQLLAMDMSILSAQDLSSLLKKLGQLDVGAVDRHDVKALVGKLLQVLGMDDSIALIELFMNSMPAQNQIFGGAKARSAAHKTHDLDRPGADSPKMYGSHPASRPRSMQMGGLSQPSTAGRRDHSGGPLGGPGAGAGFPPHHMQPHSSHHGSMSNGGSDSRREGGGRDSMHHERDVSMPSRGSMQQMGRSGGGGGRGGSDGGSLGSQGMLGSSPLQFSSAMGGSSSQPMGGGSSRNEPRNMLRRAPQNNIPLTNAATLTHAQLASLVAGGASPNVLSIPINQLNQLTQLGGMPVIVPGLAQVLHMPPNTVVQKPR